MTPAQWKQVEELFLLVADVPGPERNPLLAAEPAWLRDEVEKMLAFDNAAEERIQSIVGAGAAVLGNISHERFGPWRIKGLIGEGGMGTVYRAVRDDNTFDKQVAIKVIH